MKIIVTVHRHSARQAVMDSLSHYGEVVPYENLKSAFTVELRDAQDEAGIMWTLSSDDRVSGAVDGGLTVTPTAFEEESIYEGRLFSEKQGALRIKATQDPKHGRFNPWWRQPDFFKWQKETDRLGNGAIIAIVDGGISWGHPEFSKNPSRVKRIHNVFTTSNQGASEHGTACAAFAAGDTIGLAPEAELWDVKCFADDGSPTATTNIISAINVLLAAVNDPVQTGGKPVIVNLSFASTGTVLANPFGSVVEDLQSAGAIVLIAAGNDGQNLDTSLDAWPAESSEYAVGSIHYDGRRAGDSNFGSRVRLYGFGAGIIGPGKGNTYRSMSGTSFACPYVCGCLATWMPGRWVPQDSEQVRTLMTDYIAFCSQGIFASTVRGATDDDLVPGAVIGRASYFPVLPGDVIIPQVSVISRFGTPEYGVLGWKSRATPVIGGPGRAVTGQSAKAVAFFEGPFSWPSGGPFMDDTYVPAGWTIGNDRVRNPSGVSGAGMFVVNDTALALKEYWEVEVVGPATGMAVGVTKATNLANHNEATTGMGAAGVSWAADGTIIADGVAQTPTITYAQGDRLMLAYDTATGGFWCGKNGTWAATPGVQAALATTATGASRAAFSVPTGSALQLFGSSAHTAYSVTDFTTFDLGAESPWILDVATYAYAGHTYADGNTRLTNTTGGSNYLWWVPSVRRLLTSLPGRVYWEFHCNASGATTYDGYHALMTAEAMASRAADTANQVHPIGQGSIARRGLGQIWGGASVFGDGTMQVSGLATFGNGKKLMMLFEPSTRKIWTGVNGVWDNSPAAAATHAGPSATAEWAIAVQGRNANEGGRLVSLTSELTYPIPAGATALAAL